MKLGQEDYNVSLLSLRNAQLGFFIFEITVLSEYFPHLVNNYGSSVYTPSPRFKSALASPATLQIHDSDFHILRQSPVVDVEILHVSQSSFEGIVPCTQWHPHVRGHQRTCLLPESGLRSPVCETISRLSQLIPSSRRRAQGWSWEADLRWPTHKTLLFSIQFTFHFCTLSNQIGSLLVQLFWRPHNARPLVLPLLAFKDLSILDKTVMPLANGSIYVALFQHIPLPLSAWNWDVESGSKERCLRTSCLFCLKSEPSLQQTCSSRLLAYADVSSQ